GWGWGSGGWGWGEPGGGLGSSFVFGGWFPGKPQTPPKSAAPRPAPHQTPSALASSAAAPAYSGSDGATRRPTATTAEPKRSAASPLTAASPVRLSSIQTPPHRATTTRMIARLNPASSN